MRANCTVYLCDIETIQNVVSGDRTKKVVKIRKLNGERTSVGLSTFWSAASANVTLDCSVNIRSRMYQNQKYLLMESNLYEIYNVGKADDQVNVKLNLRQLNDIELKELIVDAVGLFQTS